MPSDSLTLAVTSGFGVGIIAGIVSGVCYVLVHGFVGKRPRNRHSQWHCSVCGLQFRSIEGVLETGRVVTCEKCGGKVCRIRCSSHEQTGWICQACHHPESWFKGILKALHPNSIRAVATKADMNPDRIDEIDEDLEILRRKEKQQVRDFIERLVEAMLGSNIDNASITRIYNDKQYDVIISRYHSDLSSVLTDLGSALHMSIANLPIIGQSPCSAHASLKLLVQRIIQEAIGLPKLTKAQDHPGVPEEDTNRTYEDLLATAILNKVIQNYQEELPSNSANSASSRLSTSSRQNDKEYFFGEETLDAKWKSNNSTAADADTTSVSSLEEWVRSDSSAGSTKYVDHMSLTIQQRIEEVTSSDDEAEAADPLRKDTLKVESEDWQDNWSLKKRRFGGTASPVPVPMLVPNPTTDAKVLIGDKEVDDTTDLSDVGSDFGDVEEMQSRESILVDSKTVIGGKNLLVNLHVEEVDNEDRNISEDSATDASKIAQERERIMEQLSSSELKAESLQSEAVDSAIAEQSDRDDTSPVSLDSHTEQDTEYTEKYATLPRTILKSPTPNTRDLKAVTNSFSGKDEMLCSSKGKIDQEGLEEDIATQNGHHESGISTDEDENHKDKFKGSYSEREKQKWYNAVEMKNNPYSAENLSRRLSSRSSNGSVTSIFGRDYYIKEATRSSGARKRPPSSEDVVDYSEMQQKTDATEEALPVTSTPDASIFKATPILIDPEGAQHQSDDSFTELTGYTRLVPNTLDLSSDSDLSIERVYNLTTGKVYEKVGQNTREIIEGSKSPEGIKYTQLVADFDENHNAETAEKKRSFLKSLTGSPTSEQRTFTISPNTSDDVISDHVVPFSLKTNPASNGTHEKSESASLQNTEAADETAESNKEFSLEYSAYDYNSTSRSNSLVSNEGQPEIVTLKDKHLVRERLGLFSKSYPNLAAVPLRKTSVGDQILSATNNKPYSTEKLSTALNNSVNDLRRKFDQIKIIQTSKEVHSLTARSIPREFRNELKEHKEPSNNTVEDLPSEAQVFPTAKSRIQFFENLKH